MKNKSLIMALLFVTMLLFSINSNAQKKGVDPWFYTTVNVPDFPAYCGFGWYAIIEITNTDFSSYYVTHYWPTVFIEDLGYNKVKVETYPGEASVKFLCDIGGIYNGTVGARVVVYTQDNNPFCSKSGGVSGSFSYNYGATITLSGFWTFK
jgi:hypothetical protein